MGIIGQWVDAGSIAIDQAGFAHALFAVTNAVIDGAIYASEICGRNAAVGIFVGIGTAFNAVLFDFHGASWAFAGVGRLSPVALLFDANVGVRASRELRAARCPAGGFVQRGYAITAAAFLCARDRILRIALACAAITACALPTARSAIAAVVFVGLQIPAPAVAFVLLAGVELLASVVAAIFLIAALRLAFSAVVVVILQIHALRTAAAFAFILTDAVYAVLLRAALRLAFSAMVFVVLQIPAPTVAFVLLAGVEFLASVARTIFVTAARRLAVSAMVVIALQIHAFRAAAAFAIVLTEAVSANLLRAALRCTVSAMVFVGLQIPAPAVAFILLAGFFFFRIPRAATKEGSCDPNRQNAQKAVRGSM